MLPTTPVSSHCWEHLTSLDLADPDFGLSRPVDIIIGADTYGLIVLPEIVRGIPHSPIAQRSIFGWLVIGPSCTASTGSCLVRSHSRSHAMTCQSLHIAAQSEENLLSSLLIKFWIQEEPPVSHDSKQLTEDEQQCEDYFKATHTRDATGRYIGRLPLKLPREQLGKSIKRATQCALQQLSRLRNCPSQRDQYNQFLQEYERLNHMQKVDTLIPSEPHYYLPHHGVFKPDSTTTKLRVVFNGSSATSTGLSLNDIMHTGENLLLNIVDVLMRIRIYPHIFATDITKMYRQINVHPEDWDLQRILWTDSTDTLVPYQLKTVTYGTKAAPYLAVRTLIQLVEDEGHNFPLAVPPILKGRYVDDIFGGADSSELLMDVATQLKDMCQAVGFPLAKWHSTNQELLKLVRSPQEDNSDISLDDCSTKLLGLRWSPQNDHFTFTYTAASPRVYTKRTLLSEVAQIFDPLGFISPVVIRAKVLLQELWLLKLKWDTPLQHEVISRWNKLKYDFLCLARLSIPRWLNTLTSSKVTLHGFADASKMAMAAVVYITVDSPTTGFTTSFVCSKTRVAPLKSLTIPRLKLTAALLLSKLIKYVQSYLHLNIQATYLWSDSQVTLTWIKSHPTRWKDYVRNRVTQIQDLLPASQWNHVPGTQNPADCATRGLSTAQLQEHSLWWHGPKWMAHSQDKWPAQGGKGDSEEALKELRPGVVFHTTATKVMYPWDLIYKYSSLHELLSPSALCFRVADIIKKIAAPHSITSPTPGELTRALHFWTKATQAVFFQTELRTLKTGTSLPKHHPFTRLTAYVDDEGIIRVGGRLDLTRMPQDHKHPAILPRSSEFTHLVIDSAHRRSLHGGTQLTLAHTRDRFWILGGRQAIKSHVLRCVKCARQRGIRAHQLMGQLPLCRVSPSDTFAHTGLDYAGPLTVKTWKGRGAKTQKGWLCIFVCFATSAVHLEAVTDYSTEAFIAAYRRFTYQRGIPLALYSDCGTNFIGANATLTKMFRQSTHEHRTIASVLSRDCSEWRFNPPGAPHMGGKWEAVVKSVKFHLRRTVGETLLTFEELTTMLTQIEGLLNSRPLQAMTDDPDDLTVLTPGHFLIGRPLTAIPEPTHDETSLSLINRWKFVQRRVQFFWKHWSAHYLHRFQSISKWHHSSHQIKVGSLVLLTDERFPPSKWPMARIITLHPGKDELTRVVTIKTATTTLTRPISKLCILPVPVSSETQPEDNVDVPSTAGGMLENQE